MLTQLFSNHTALSTPAVNFWAGGLSAQVFWLTSYPSDVVKQRIMTDSLDPDKRRYRRWWHAAKAVHQEAGWKGYWRGFVPCALRAFPANAMALVSRSLLRQSFMTGMLSPQLLTLSRSHSRALCEHYLDEPDRLRPQIPCAF